MKSKNPVKRKSLKLDINADINFKLLGISSHENDYRLVWAINNNMKFNYVRSENLIVHLQKLKQDMSFSRFIHTDEERYMTFYLISNRSPDGFLFPEIKNIDFLIQVVGEIQEKQVEQMIKELRNISIISGAYLIDNRKLKDIGKIIPV